jgi:parallel beta-helix repeat protein
LLWKSSNNIIAENIIANNNYGVYLSQSSYNSMVGNDITNNWYGIYLSDSSYNSISGNNITANNNYGVYLSQSSNNIITGNSFVNDGLFVKSSYGNVVVDNLVNGKPLIYLEGISGYTIKNAGQVILIKCSYILVENLNLSNTDVGIELWITENIIIVRNNISANNFEGIYLSQSSNNIITGSTIANNLFGIFLSDASNNIIAENTIANNFEGISLQESSNNNSIVENTITGNTNGITLYDSPKYNSIIRNNITNNVANGISLGEHSDNNLIIGNSIMYNYVGIHLYYSSCNNKIIGNIITGIGLYSWNAIDLDSSSNDNLITENNFTNHEYTIRLYSSNNRIYHNNFIHCRTSHVVGPGYTNNWDDGYPSGGNYWSDYAGVDEHSGPYQNITGGDGIGDTPYVIDANNIDRYPLMQPVTILTYYLTISATLDGTTIPSPGIHIYVNGTSLNVKAIPNIGYSLDYWLLDGNMRTENPITIIMNANHTLEAYFIDDIPPEMSDPWQDPPANNVQPFQDVTVWVNVTDYGTGIKNVTLWYSIDNGLEWTILNMTEISEDTYQAIIRGYGNCTWVTYKIVAYDNAGNNATKDNNGYGYQYHVIPEYPLALILVMLMLTTLIATIPLKKRRTKNNFLNSEGLI